MDKSAVAYSYNWTLLAIKMSELQLWYIQPHEWISQTQCWARYKRTCDIIPLIYSSKTGKTNPLGNFIFYWIITSRENVQILKVQDDI